jgi:hypothetical protein
MPSALSAIAAAGIAGIIAAKAVAGAVILDPGAARRAGIAVQSLAATRLAPTVQAVGAVLNPAGLLRLRGRVAAAAARVAAAAAKLALEQKEEARARLLYGQAHNISAADLQKEEEDVAAAQALLAEARAKRAALLEAAGIDWGGALATALAGGGDPLPQLANGSAMLVGLGLPPGTVLAAPPRRAVAEAAGIRFPLSLIGPVPRMLGGYPGQSLLYRSAAQAGVPIGATVVAFLPAGPERTGVVVPRSAVLWRAGRPLVFRVRSGNRFEPVTIATDAPAAGGYFVSAALKAGDRIVVRGAALLLGAGEGPAAGGEDED